MFVHSVRPPDIAQFITAQHCVLQEDIFKVQIPTIQAIVAMGLMLMHSTSQEEPG
jgi:hypothetical protein